MKLYINSIHADAREATARQTYKAVIAQERPDIAIAIILLALDDWYEKGKIHGKQDLGEEVLHLVGMSDADQWKQDRNLMEHYRRTLQDIAHGAVDPKGLAAKALANFIPDEDTTKED